ncbi:uncharacterized protein LOC131866532 isoform X1 [Cryptomeria japonica]|uniref:uncharacterized protein LOC131866531 isoform X1 n=1 Tax=Cryptomeria japonica TaxID=3369 RepID=UPI0027DA9C4C|nr:uncharacterized protein LOC131866531 isoform X1 [Cryptomeria japonica]XP_059071452.1 uncharacterized protein LOC131866532 isoform X1 [Cryptomeria japonica]
MESVAPFKSDKPFCTMDLKSWNVNQPHVLVRSNSLLSLEDNQAEEGDDEADGLAMNDANEEENGDREDGMAIHKVDEEEDKEDGSTNHEVVESKANDEADNGGNADPKEEKVSTHHRTERCDRRLLYFCEYDSCCVGVRQRFWNLKSLNAHRALKHNLPFIPPGRRGRKPIVQRKHQ